MWMSVYGSRFCLKCFQISKEYYNVYWIYHAIVAFPACLSVGPRYVCKAASLDWVTLNELHCFQYEPPGFRCFLNIFLMPQEELWYFYLFILLYVEWMNLSWNMLIALVKPRLDICTYEDLKVNFISNRLNLSRYVIN